jgi:tetratricopeptide (TPR) repeat protein
MIKLFYKSFLIMLLSAPLGNLEAQTTAADRLANIEKLLNQSSGAKQVINSGNSEAQLKRREALDAYRQAQQKIASGNEQASTDLLNQSTRLMFEAIKLSTPTSLGEGKNIDNYGQRRESVIALQDAFNRISDENHETETRGRVNDQLATLVNQADSLLQRGKNTEARIEIDKAYHLLKVSIESIRSGQTLVRSLQFDSKEEEYLYEIDRNDTHSMLISLLVDEKQKSNSMKQKIVDYVAEARVLRQQAEAFASKNAHEQAIELLEQSTRQLVRAIRSAGIYIPG